MSSKTPTWWQDSPTSTDSVVVLITSQHCPHCVTFRSSGKAQELADRAKALDIAFVDLEIVKSQTRAEQEDSIRQKHPDLMRFISTVPMVLFVKNGSWGKKKLEAEIYNGVFVKDVGSVSTPSEETEIQWLNRMAGNSDAGVSERIASSSKWGERDVNPWREVVTIGKK